MTESWKQSFQTGLALGLFGKARLHNGVTGDIGANLYNPVLNGRHSQSAMIQGLIVGYRLKNRRGLTLNDILLADSAGILLESSDGFYLAVSR